MKEVFESERAGLTPLPYSTTLLYLLPKSVTSNPKIGRDSAKTGGGGKGNLSSPHCGALELWWGNVICPSFYGIQRKPTFLVHFSFSLKKKKERRNR